MKKIYMYIFIFCALVQTIQSYQYFTGHTFRNFCDYVLDQTSSFRPENVKNGATVFVKTDYIYDFFKNYFPKITAKFVLVTHNSDQAISDEFRKFLDNEKIIAWFAKNAVIPHSKLIGIPIGMVYRYMFGLWVHGVPEDLNEMIEKVQQGKTIKNKLLYMNFSLGIGRGKERPYVWNLFKNKSFCHIAPVYGNIPNKPYKEYLNEIAESKFMLSPRGSGWDCYRTWEALIMGSYPIVRRSPIDALYEGLPVLIVDNWTDITEKFLEEKYKEFSSRNWNFEKLYAPYWIALIKQATESVL